MRAILRYAFLKTSREQLLPALLFAPATIFFAPLLVLAVRNLVLGRAVYPVALEARLGPQASAAVLWEASLPFAAIVAGIAAFRALRNEVVSKTVGSFYLASPPHSVTTAITLYGTAVGTTAYVVAVLVVSILTATPHPDLGGHVLIAFASSAITSALATLILAISHDFTMLVAVCAAGLVVAMTLKSGGAAGLGATLLGVVILMVISQYVWGRRCAD